MRPELAEEVAAWLSKASGDLRAAEVDLAASPPILEDVVFHCQQAAEKAIKAFLTAHESVFRKTHDIEEIGRAAIAIDASLAPLLERASVLTPFAWQFRYPGDDGEPERSDVEAALRIARDVFKEISARLPAESRQEQA